jgi:hypothetical protein
MDCASVRHYIYIYIYTIYARNNIVRSNWRHRSLETSAARRLKVKNSCILYKYIYIYINYTYILCKCVYICVCVCIWNKKMVINVGEIDFRPWGPRLFIADHPTTPMHRVDRKSRSVVFAHRRPPLRNSYINNSWRFILHICTILSRLLYNNNTCDTAVRLKLKENILT